MRPILAASVLSTHTTTNFSFHVSQAVNISGYISILPYDYRSSLNYFIYNSIITLTQASEVIPSVGFCAYILLAKRLFSNLLV